MCDKIVFIQKGNIITPETQGDGNEVTVKITTSTITDLQKFLRSNDYEIFNLTYNSVDLKIDPSYLEELTSEIAKNKIPFSTVEQLTESLEDKFLSMMRGDLVD